MKFQKNLLFLFLLLFLFVFSLKAQKMTYGLKAGATLSLNSNFSKGFQLGGVADLRFRRLILKNELLYSHFFHLIKNNLENSKAPQSYQIDYALLPSFRFKRKLAFYLGGVFSLSFSNRQANPFNIGIEAGLNFYLKKLILNLGLEFPKFLHPTPYLLKLSFGYNLRKR